MFYNYMILLNIFDSITWMRKTGSGSSAPQTARIPPSPKRAMRCKQMQAALAGVRHEIAAPQLRLYPGRAWRAFVQRCLGLGFTEGGKKAPLPGKAGWSYTDGMVCLTRTWNAAAWNVAPPHTLPGKRFFKSYARKSE
jgi:hypothetical protein